MTSRRCRRLQRACQLLQLRMCIGLLNLSLSSRLSHRRNLRSSRSSRLRSSRSSSSRPIPLLSLRSPPLVLLVARWAVMVVALQVVERWVVVVRHRRRGRGTAGILCRFATGSLHVARWLIWCS